MTVDLLVNPFCMAERDVGVVGKLCEKYDVPLNTYNLWDLDERDVDELPDYVSVLVKACRAGRRPGTVYCSAFVNGERVPLNNWPKHMETLEEKIASAARAAKP